MQVTVDTTNGLERRMRVQIPEDRVQGEVDKRLGDMARSMRIPGFRPGKTPVKVVRQRFGRAVRDEVVGDMVRSSLVDAIGQEQLNPAGMPTIEPVSSEPGQGVVFTAVFDVYPDIDLPPVESLQIARPRAQVEDADVDRMIETLRRQRRAWESVERPAAIGDRVVINFRGEVDGQALEQGEGTEVPLELGSGRMIPGFEDGLVGANGGQQRPLSLQFPDDYPAAELAGKPVEFSVEVQRVEEGRLPAVDDEFAASFGVADGGAEGLRLEVRNNMTRELNEALSAITKQRVMESLLSGKPVDLPTALVEQERDRAMEQSRTEMIHSGVDPQAIELRPEAFEEAARRRVALGLLLNELIKVNDIEVDTEKVRARIETVASTYEDPNEVIGWYYSDPARLSDIESTVLEGQVVDWVLERASVTEERTSFDEVLNPGQTSAAI